MFGKKKEKACKNCSNAEVGREISSRTSSNARNCEAGREAKSSKSSKKCK